MRVPRIPDADGNPAAVDWTKAAKVANRAPDSSTDWATVDGFPTEREIRGLIAHDGKYLYLTLSEERFEATGLLASDKIEKDDTWEIYIAKERGREKPFRRISVNPHWKMLAQSFFQNGNDWDIGASAKSEVTGNRWTLILALPLE